MDGLFRVWNSEVVGVNINFWHSVTIRHKSAAWGGVKVSDDTRPGGNEWIVLVKKVDSGQFNH